jgi:hypothetical protein
MFHGNFFEVSFVDWCDFLLEEPFATMAEKISAVSLPKVLHRESNWRLYLAAWPLLSYAILKLSKHHHFDTFLFSGHEPIYFIENKEKTLRASYDRGTQIVDYMD